MRRTAILLASASASAVYLGLAVLGAGGLAAFFSHPALLWLCIVVGVAAVIGVMSAGNLSPGVREDRGNRWVFVAFGILGFLGAWLPAYTDRHDLWTLDGEGLRWWGTVLAALGCALRIAPVFVLGNRFSGLVAIQPGHRLVTTGLYGVIRNPSYLGLLVFLVGWALAFRSVAGLLLAALTLLPLIARIRSEEALLQSEFGAEYDAYRARTWRLAPWLY